MNVNSYPQHAQNNNFDNDVLKIKEIVTKGVIPFRSSIINKTQWQGENEWTLQIKAIGPRNNYWLKHKNENC